jgi:hypothetical protein
MRGTLMRLQMPKTQMIETKNSQSFSMFTRKKSIFIKNPFYGNMGILMQRFFGIFTNEAINDRPNHEKTAIESFDNARVDETNSLQHLENCANAARETEACGQYEWIDKSNE